uniref:Uncharacterized protein n=1 Tax=Arundo donax TaxID=35708 RepID=A0A0A9EMK1_ARUDO
MPSCSMPLSHKVVQLTARRHCHYCLRGNQRREKRKRTWQCH